VQKECRRPRSSAGECGVPSRRRGGAALRSRGPRRVRNTGFASHSCPQSHRLADSACQSAVPRKSITAVCQPHPTVHAAERSIRVQTACRGGNSARGDLGGRLGLGGTGSSPFCGELTSKWQHRGAKCCREATGGDSDPEHHSAESAASRATKSSPAAARCSALRTGGEG